MEVAIANYGIELAWGVDKLAGFGQDEGVHQRAE